MLLSQIRVAGNVNREFADVYRCRRAIERQETLTVELRVNVASIPINIDTYVLSSNIIKHHHPAILLKPSSLP